MVNEAFIMLLADPFIRSHIHT